MPYAVVQQIETPNPAARKFIVDKVLSKSPKSYFNAAAASDDPLGRALFAISGVTNVLILDNWVTISKAPDVQWKAVAASVTKALVAAE